ncbi:MAG: hypothetical protein OHK0047_29770 [Leptolyngbyaceae cyanobacterium]
MILPKGDHRYKLEAKEIYERVEIQQLKFPKIFWKFVAIARCSFPLIPPFPTFKFGGSILNCFCI